MQDVSVMKVILSRLFFLFSINDKASAGNQQLLMQRFKPEMANTKIPTYTLSTLNRPAGLQQFIDDKFKELSSTHQTRFRFWGSPAYGNANINEEKMINHMVLEGAKTKQTDFFILDIGAGNGEWGDNLFGYINGEKFTAIPAKPHIR